MTRLFFALALFSFLSSCKYQKQETVLAEKIEVKTGDVRQSIHFSGRIRSENSMLVRAPVEGHLVELRIGLGKLVRAGESIAIITEPKNTRRTIDLIQKQGELNKIDLKKAQLVLKIKNIKEELHGMERLIASGSISPQEKKLKNVELKLELKELDIVKAQEKTVKKEIRHLRKNQLNSSRILRAPISGVVTKLWTSEEKITPGMSIAKDTEVAVIEQTGRYVLKGEVSEPNYIKMELGQKVNIQLAHVNDVSWVGTVKSLSPFADRESLGFGLFTVSVVFTADKNDLKTGLEGIGQIALAERTNVVRVPRAALNKFEDGYFVSIPSQNGPKEHEVNVGLVGDQYAEITAGLEPGNIIFQAFSAPL